MRHIRALLNGPEPDDIMLNDFVRVGFGGPVGTVREINGDHALIAWDGNQRDIIPIKALRRAPQRGHKFDTRRGE